MVLEDKLEKNTAIENKEVAWEEKAGSFTEIGDCYTRFPHTKNKNKIRRFCKMFRKHLTEPPR